jgi:hypothetical protein
MEEKIQNIIPTLSIVLGVNLEAYGNNESHEFLGYYLRCNARERAVVDKVLVYICAKTFAEILLECGIRIGEKGELLDVPPKE